MGQLADITDRKQAEEAIRSSERRLLEALRVARMGHWEYNVPENLLTFNDHYFTLHKTTAEAVGGYQMTADRFASEFMFPDDVPLFQEELNQVIATSDRDYQKQLEARLICADGEVRWFVIWFRVEMDKDGRTIKLHGVSQDIHDRKLAEEKVRHHAAHAEALAHTATQINRQGDLDATLTSVCEDTARVFNAEAAVIIQVDPLTQTVNAVSAHGLPFDIKKDIPPIPLAIISKRLALLPDIPIVLQDYKPKIRIPGGDLINKYNVRTIAFTRINWQSQLIGVLIVVSIGHSRYFDDDELSLLRSLADESAQAIMNARYLNDASRRLARLEALRTIDNAIAASLDLRHTLSVFLDQLRHQLNVDAADILLFNPHELTYDYAFGIGMRTDGLSDIEVHADDDPIGMIVLNRHRVQIQDFQKEIKSDRIKVFIAEGFVSYVGVPLIAKGQVRGVLEIFHRTPKKFDEEWIDFLESLAGQAAISIDNASLFDDLQRSNLELSLAYDATIEGWSHALDLRDEGTEGHTQRVTRLTLELANEMGINDETLTHIRRGAMLHDIGKMGIPDEILHKPDKLNDEELAAMRKHPGYAYEMLSKVRYLKPSLDIPYCHHEKWDGTGYPRGLKGEQIPLAARLFAVVDVWDALISDRPYRSAWSKEKAYEYIKEQSGKYFDPDIVKIFLKTVKPALNH
jgi:putative nucleotidyltransferase with HDIG domain